MATPPIVTPTAMLTTGVLFLVVSGLGVGDGEDVDSLAPRLEEALEADLSEELG